MSLGSGKTPLICTVLLILATGGNAEEVLISRQQRALAYPLNSCTGVSKISLTCDWEYFITTDNFCYVTDPSGNISSPQAGPQKCIHVI